MGEENNIFSKFGKPEILLSLKGAPTRLPIVESIIEESIELDHAKTRKEALSNAMKIPPMSYQFDILSADIEKILGMDKTVDSFETCSLVVESKPRINRPKNLKYPNKKRARRIWNKWRNWFGVTPSRRTVIPKAILSVTPTFRNNQTYYDIEAAVEKGDLNAERK